MPSLPVLVHVWCVCSLPGGPSRLSPAGMSVPRHLLLNISLVRFPCAKEKITLKLLY